MLPMQAFKICTHIWAAWFAIWLIWALQSKRTQESEGVASLFSYAIPVWVSILLIAFPRSLGPLGRTEILPPGTPLAITAIAITVLGFALTLWARYILGSNWSSTVTIKVDHQLIRTGPYRHVRHPIYTGLIIAMIGTIIALDEWRGVPAVFFLWLGFTIKRLKEEQFMHQTFGDRYTDYARTAGAIFPTLLRRGN